MYEIRIYYKREHGVKGLPTPDLLDLAKDYNLSWKIGSSEQDFDLGLVIEDMNKAICFLDELRAFKYIKESRIAEIENPE